MERLANFSQNDKWGRCNKRGGWSKSPKLINGEIGINREAGKNTGVCVQKILDQS